MRSPTSSLWLWLEIHFFGGGVGAMKKTLCINCLIRNHIFTVFVHKKFFC